MAEIKSKLDDVIEEEIDSLGGLKGEEKTKAIRDLVQLHKLRIEEIKTEAEVEDRRLRREMDGEKNDADLSLKEEQFEFQKTQGTEELALKKCEAAQKEADRAREDKAAKQQAKENMIDRCLRTGVAVAELVLPLAFYRTWMKRGFEFETTGSFTSTTFKNLLNRFRPTK